MTPEELMIGDLVTFKDCQNDEVKTIIKIWGLNSDGDAFAFIDGRDALDEINIDDEIVGIPLTPEILEKNGFLQNGIGSDEIEILDPDYSDETYVWQERDEYDNLFTVSVYNLNDGIGNWSLEIVDSPKGKMELEIKYVHELQHCLKLCGIDKTIEL